MLSNSKPYLIGETAFHHEGDVNFLERLVEEGIRAGVDTLKFHLLFDIDDYVVESHSARNKLIDMQIPVNFWEKLHKKLGNQNIRPIYLCNDAASLKWVNSLPDDTVDGIELHATGINDIFLLKEALNFNGTTILGSGGSTLDDIHFAVDFLKENDKDDILLMHGFQNYPTDYRDIIFSKIGILKKVFNLPVGYADHTDPADDLNTYISCLPQASGSHILEKHFTHKPNEDRIDSQAAVSIKQLKEIRELMNIIYLTHGPDPLKMSDAEQKYGDTGPMKKAIVARKNLPAGIEISVNNIAYKRTSRSVPVKQRDIFNFIGAKTSQSISKDSPLTYENVEYHFQKAETHQFKLKED